jgi:hypothetical protein
MDNASESRTKLRAEARRRRQHTVALRTAYEATMPQIRAIVSNWYTTNSAIKHASSRCTIERERASEAAPFLRLASVGDSPT